MLPSLRRSVQAAVRPARVRFAPSPTGYLHVGGLRTALFNYLLARSTGGVFVLRIEDTDQTRLVPGAADALQRALDWTGLHCDEGPSQGGAYGPYVQSERLAIYRSYAERLVRAEKAYRDFRPPAARDVAARTSALLREAYLPPSEDEAQERMANGESHVVRLKMDPSRTFSYTDGVYGPMSFRPDAMGGVSDDPIIMKSDGWPTYHLASVVDDTEMAITHVLRGEEWLPSMPKHLALYEAIEAPPPTFVHLPLLINADGSKLSKRSGDVRVEDYEKRGFEPEALVNLVALTGYNHQGESEESDVMGLAQLVRQFDLGRISHSRATLPTDKLPFLNRRHLAAKMQEPARHDENLARLRPLFAEIGAGEASADALLQAALLGCQRVDTIDELPQSVAYLFREPQWADEGCRAFRASVPTASFGTFRISHTDAVLHGAQALFSGISVWDKATLHAALQRWMKEQVAAKLGGGRAAVQKSLRIALSGQKVRCHAHAGRPARCGYRAPARQRAYACASRGRGRMGRGAPLRPRTAGCSAACRPSRGTVQ